MNEVRIIPFEASHVDFLEVRDHEKSTMRIDPASLQGLAAAGSGGTMIYDGRVIGIVGYLELWEGTLEVWIIPSKYVSQYAIMFAKQVKRLLKSIVETHNPARLQTEALADELHDEWMTFLGFEAEGTLKKFVNGMDYRMWARIYDDGR